MRYVKVAPKGRTWLGGFLTLCLSLGLAVACDTSRQPPQEPTGCLFPPCDGGSTTEGSAPEGVLQECTPNPNGVPPIGRDMVPHACDQPNWAPAACVDGVTQTKPKLAGLHVCLPNPISYSDNPPTSGTHRGEWGKWGEYSFIPPQRWLHNLEHGGIAFLYHPCAPKAVIDQLRNLAKGWPEDPQEGAFRWILTPAPKLSTAIAVVAWGALYTAHCVKPAQITTFIQANYLKAPENVRSDGSYSALWISR